MKNDYQGQEVTQELYNAIRGIGYRKAMDDAIRAAEKEKEKCKSNTFICETCHVLSKHILTLKALRNK